MALGMAMAKQNCFTSRATPLRGNENRVLDETFPRPSSALLASMNEAGCFSDGKGRAMLFAPSYRHPF